MATLRTWRTLLLFRVLLLFVATSLAWLQVGPAYGLSVSTRREEARQAAWRTRQEAWHLAHLPHNLAPGLTQTPDAALQKKIDAQAAAARAARPVADVRPLTAAEMGGARGRGPLRNAYFNGTLPWQKSLRDVNLCNGNLFKSFTDVQVAPARGAGLVLQRTYNSNDARIGPFGMGWTHAYDIRVQEAAQIKAENGQAAGPADTDMVPRTDFFGAKHSYHRDADGLYSPPAYLYDETNSTYNQSLITGPLQVTDDTEKGMDGTVKHYTNVVTNADGTGASERACDYIQDRYNNKTTLTYGLSYVQADGSTRKLLTKVADPTGRTLTFAWTNFGTGSQPAYRITEVDAPTDLTTGARVYRVTYSYYAPGDANAGGAAYQLKSVTLDPDGLSRTTTYTYTSCSGTYYDASGNNPQTTTEYGLLASVADPLGHTVSYTYSAVAYVSQGNYGQPPAGTVIPKPTGTVWVSTVTEPAGVDGGGAARTQTWTINPQYSATAVSSSAGAYFYMGFDSQWRFDGFVVSNTTGSLDTPVYDADNNILKTSMNYSWFGPLKDGNHYDTYTYGQHGNMLTHIVTGTQGTFPGTDQTTYYNASQYFQKASVTDMNSHTTTMGVGTSTAGNAGDPDPNIGDRGQTLWVQDAGFNDSTSPSYHKQFTYTYNQYGQKLSETNLNGIVTRYYYGGDSSSYAAADTDADDTGNLIAVVQDPGSGHLGRTTLMRYDIMGRVLSSTDPSGLTSTFTYNNLGQPLSVVTPMRGTTPGETISYVYDLNGRTHSVTDGRGQTTMAYETGSDRVSSVTDPVTGTLSYTYRLSGERTSMTLPGGGTWTYTYTDTNPNDQNNQLPDPDPNNPGNSFTYVSGFWVMPKGDPDSITLLPDTLRDDQGRTVYYTLNFAGQMLSADTNRVYTGSGGLYSHLTTTCLLDAASPGSVNFDTHGWLGQTQTTFYGQNLSHQNIQRIVSENDYGYDTMGQRLSNAVGVQQTNADGSGKVDGSNNPIMTTRTEAYTYDALNRLKTVNYGDGLTQSYGFDAMGNRLQKTDSTVGTTNSTYDAANRLTATTGTGASTYTNDADGNTLTGGGRTNTWDSQNRLVSCVYNGTTSTFTYGADGLRRQATVSGITTDYVYDGSTLIREGHASGGTLTTVTATYLTGPRGPEYRRDDTQTELDSQGRTVSKTRWYVYDGLGSVVGEMDSNGSLTSSPKYDVYGLVRANSGTASSKMGFVGGLGHLSEASTGLIYMRARYYDPTQGRFASEDENRNGINWYRYASDDPVNRVDATGDDDKAILLLGQLIWAVGIQMLKTGTRSFEAAAAAMISTFLAGLAAQSVLPTVLVPVSDAIEKFGEAIEGKSAIDSVIDVIGGAMLCMAGAMCEALGGDTPADMIWDLILPTVLGRSVDKLGSALSGS